MRRGSLVLVLLGCFVGCGGSVSLDPQTSKVAVDRSAGVVADGADAAVATVHVMGDDGKPMAGISVSLSVDGTGGSVSPAQLTTDAKGDGQAKVTSTRADVKTLSAVAQLKAQSVKLGSVRVAFVAGAPDAAHSLLNVPASAHTGESLPITLQIADAHDNPCPDVVVSLSVSGSGNTLTPTSGVTGADGTLSASLSSTQAEAKTITATLAGFDLTGVTTVTVPAWANVGPEGGDAKLFALDPANASIAYAASSHGGLFKTVDRGATWVPIDNGLTEFDFTDLEIDPFDPSRIFAGTQFKTFRSTDAGASWQLLDPTQELSGAIAFDPTQANVVYAGSYLQKVLRSTDGGDTWTQSTDTLDSPVVAVAVDPAAPSVVYAATGTGIYKSTDAGMHWTRAMNGMSAVPTFEGLVLAPTTPATVFAYGLGSGVWRSVDGAASWTQVSGLDAYPARMVVDPRNAMTVWEIDGGANLQRSVDAGATWAQVTSPANVVVGLGLSPVDSQLVFASAWKQGIFQSGDQGASWGPSGQGLRSVEVDSLSVDPAATSTLVACGESGDPITSTDAGAQWAPFGSSFPGGVDEQVIEDPAAPGTYVLVTSDSVYSSTGGAWTQLGSGISSQPYLDSIVAGPTVMYVHGSNSGVYKRTAGSSTWSSASSGLSGLGITGLAIDPTNDHHVYASTSQGVYETVDAGGSWSPAGAGTISTELSAIAVSPSTPATLYAGGVTGKVFRSTDSGATWTMIRDETSFQPVTAIAVDPSNPDVVYVATESEGLWKSIDAGATWAAKDSGLWFPTVKTIVIDPFSDGIIYLGTGAGVFKTTTAGD